jgi:hypothetical protein
MNKFDYTECRIYLNIYIYIYENLLQSQYFANDNP